MKTNLIIGAGQLGSRHLQGLLNSDIAQEIYVLDPSVESLNIAKERAKEFLNRYNVHYISDWSTLPDKFDLAIIATGANVRRQVIEQLLHGYNVNYLILEKVLFQDLQSYSDISDLIKEKSIPTWVNHPRRMFDYYRRIRASILTNDSPAMINIVGANWGLGCNGLHFIDMCTYITGSPVSSINCEWIENTIIDSKRSGYKEFIGTLTGTLKNNSCFSISSLKGESNLLSIFISIGSDNWVIEEGANPTLFYQQVGFPNSTHKESLSIDFQSKLTSRLAEDILKRGTCLLPTYEEACSSHLPFIKTLLQKYNSITGLESNICPIT